MDQGTDRQGSWDDLRVFRAVAQLGSLSRAAEALGMTQPTVGRRLDRLEEDFGVALLRRTSQGCALTDAGQALLPHAERMYAAAIGMHQLANTARNDLSGVVRIATGDMPALHLAAHLPELVAGAPKLRLEIVTGVDFVSLERGDADIGVRSARPDGDAFTVHDLGFKPFGVFANPAWLRANPHASARENWPRCSWAGFESRISVMSSRWLAAEIGRAPDYAFSNSIHTLEAVAAGVGLGVLPQYLGDSDPRLVRVGGAISGLGLQSFLVIHPSARRLPRVRWVAQRLRRLLAGAA